MTSDAPYHDHPRAFVERVAQVLGGRRVDAAHVRGSVNSEDDRFLNQLFSDDAASDDDVDRALAGRPGFVWVGHDRPVTTAMQAMTSSTRARGEHHAGSDIREVRHDDDLAGWHDVYSEVLGAGPRSLGDWRRIHAALGPSGDRSLVLVLARVDGIPAATGGVYVTGGWAGLYCFTTRERMRGRGLCTALVHACHAAAHERGAERALLHATTLGAPVYAAAGYAEGPRLPLLVR